MYLAAGSLYDVFTRFQALFPNEISNKETTAPTLIGTRIWAPEMGRYLPVSWRFEKT
jgi:hypothetical protein